MNLFPHSVSMLCGLSVLLITILAQLALAQNTTVPQTNADQMMRGGPPPQGGAPGNANGPKKEFPDFKDVAKDFKKVVSTADGRCFYTIWTREKDGQMLAELSPGFEGQHIFIAYTIAGGVSTAGEQVGDMYCYWKRYNKRLALMQPNIAVRTTGDLESQKARDRVFTDRVILDVPILAMGPGGGPVIDMDAFLLGNAHMFFGYRVSGLQATLAKIVKAKAFPKNVEIAYEAPLRNGRLGTLHYSISALPRETGYKPRKADARVGFFTTTHKDIGDASAETPWIRYINRWKLEKADPKLKLSPPKEPIVFYLEHTIPVRYRRWIREGVLEWNKAFENIGIFNAIECYQQDARTGAHMDKDPEDVRYNFVIWTNAENGYAIGPSRVHPSTGQILDADISIPEEFITGWSKSWERFFAEAAMESMTPQTRAWLIQNPQWDPRLHLAPPSQRVALKYELARQFQQHQTALGYDHPATIGDPTLMGDDDFDGLAGRTSQVNGACRCASGLAREVALYRMMDEVLWKENEDDEDDEGDEDNGEKEEPEFQVDGMPESFVGPLVKDLIMHEFGHILGLRHNFKASAAYSLEDVNSEDFSDEQTIAASVMDYLPLNVNTDEELVQGDYGMMSIGAYDYWAIEYGYSFDDLKPVLERVNEPELMYLTDEDTWGPDPRARTFDFGADPLNYAESQIQLVNRLRGEILDRLVEEGEPWAKARRHYEYLLSRQFGAIAIAANFLGGIEVNRDHKGDPGDRDPLTPISAQQQRRALQFVIDQTFVDEAYGLSTELLAKMTTEKWWDPGGFRDIFQDPAWPIHDRIGGLQSAAITMLLNPGVLDHVYDNELRIAADEDALTLPEIIDSITDAIFSELESVPSKKTTVRQPLISSLRRNLQREYLERLIDLGLAQGGYSSSAKPVANLAILKLQELDAAIGDVLDGKSSKIDRYSTAHLMEAKTLIERALEAQYIYNTDDLIGSSYPFFYFRDTEN